MESPQLFITLRDLVDIAVASLLFWGAIWWLRRTRALPAFLGLSILAAVYLAAELLQLHLTAWIFQGFAAVLLVLVVVVFQDDLRRLLEQIGKWGLRRPPVAAASGGADILVRTLARLAHRKIGALVVIQGKEPLDRLLDGGISLEGHLSEPLLVSLFDPHSPGHDGALLVAGDRILRYAVHLPLSGDHAQLDDRGTRHAAALGLAERSDALAIVVSEERGIVSVARNGKLRQLATAQELTAVLRDFEAYVRPGPADGRGVVRLLGSQWANLALAGVLAGGLWLLLGPGASVVEVARLAPVVVENLPPQFELVSVDPAEVTVVVSGPRRRLYLARDDAFEVRIDAFLAQLGRRTFRITAQEVKHPPETDVIEISPSVVKLDVQAPVEKQAAPSANEAE